MKKIFSFCPWQPITSVVQNIISLVNPEKIFLLSVISRTEQGENVFLMQAPSANTLTALHILVLASENEQKPNDELQDVIEHRCGENIELTAFVLRIDQFNEWLMKDHPFASMVYKQAGLLYDTDHVPLAIPNEYDAITSKKTLQEMLDTNIARAVEFVSGADLFVLRKRYALAAFHLHQAAEQLYSGLVWYITGLRVHTHNLDKLYRYARHLLPGVYDVFPRDSEQEKALFKCLQKAYTDGRYNGSFSVEYKTVSKLVERIQKLLELCKTLPNQTMTHI